MATKRFCDKCGKEVTIPENIYQLEHSSVEHGDLLWDLCRTCFQKLRTEILPRPVYTVKP